MHKVPDQPENSIRIILDLAVPQRLDAALLGELRIQNVQSELKQISRSAFKALFKARRIQLKGQSAVPSSFLAQGKSFVDILGFAADSDVKSQTPAN